MAIGHLLRYFSKSWVSDSRKPVVVPQLFSELKKSVRHRGVCLLCGGRICNESFRRHCDTNVACFLAGDSAGPENVQARFICQRRKDLL